MNEHKSFLVDLATTIDRHLPRRSTQQNTSQATSSRLRRFLRWLTPNGGTLLLVAVLIVTAQVWAKPLTSPTSAPGPSATTVNYQGRLADSDGAPLDDTLGMSFSLWDADTGGSLVWGPESHAAVPVSEGLFSVGLGSQTGGGIPTNVWDGDRYLEISVGGETLSPRELIRSVPIAGMALTLPDHTVDGDMLASTGFGTSNVALRNFVVRGPVTASDFSNTAQVDEAIWDLSPIVGNSAEMVALLVAIGDEETRSYFAAWPNGEGMHTGYNASLIRALNVGNRNETMWVRCDENQTIRYQVFASGDTNTELTVLKVTVIGWVESAATP